MKPYQYFIALLFLVEGCSSSGGSSTVIGHAWGNTGSIQGVLVTAGGSSATSDGEGRFLIEIPSGGTTVIKLAKDGLAPAYRPLSPGGASQVTLSVYLHQPTLSITVDVTNAPATLSVGSEISLDFPQGSIRTESGATPQGPVDATLTWIGRINPSLSPVPLVGTDGDETWPMVSYGMFDLELSYQGERCQIADGASVGVKIPVLPGDESEAHMFSVDLKRGIWKLESPAVNDGQFWTGEITHLSWWNLDLFWKVPPEQRACIVFRARSPTGAPIEGMSIRSAPSERYTFGGTTNRDGDLCNDRFPLGVTIEAQWGVFLNTTSVLGVLGRITFTPSAAQAKCGKPDCQVVEIPVECLEDRHCGDNWRCVDGECTSAGGGGDVTGSCLYSNDTCYEFGEGFQEANVSETCAQGQGTFSTDPCPTTNEVGRCRFNQGTQGRVETVYYAPTYTGLEADLKEGCETAFQGVWIPKG